MTEIIKLDRAGSLLATLMPKQRSLRLRTVAVFLHRWAGLTMALFLVIEGLTGSLLAFHWDLVRWLDPRQVAHAPYAGAPHLELAALNARAEALAPHARVEWQWLVRDDEVLIHMAPRINPVSNRSFAMEFEDIALDPWSGRELARYGAGNLEPFGAKVMPFIYSLHKRLAVDNPAGEWALAIIALVWLADCFVGVYLTFPAKLKKFWQRWKPAWGFRLRSGAFRLNYDLHRAGSLWLWAVLLVFAVSSVELVDKTGFYSWASQEVLGPWPALPISSSPSNTGDPLIDWQGAQQAGDQIADRLAAEGGFNRGRALLLNGPSEDYPFYQYRVEVQRPFPHDQGLTFEVNARTGQMGNIMDMNSDNRVQFVSNWLAALHMIDSPVNYLPYRIFVCLFGIALTTISFTGIVIWWKKRRARSVASLRYA